MLAELAPREAVDDGVLLNHVGGRWCRSVSGELGADLDPAAPADPLGRVTRSTADEAEQALRVAAEAQVAWSRTPPLRRAAVLRRAADLLRERSATLARAITREEGKPYREAQAEALRAAEVLDVVTGLAHRPSGEVLPARHEGEWLLTLSAPLGVVVVISPWNFPLLIPAWKIAPALLAGNAVVFKPAELTPIAAAQLVQAFSDAGLPAGVLNLVHGPGSVLAHGLLRPPVAAVSFTGGNDAGASVAEAAVREHLKFQLELGGSNPVLVLSDADIGLAVAEIVAGATSSTGQKCTATRRVFVEHGVSVELIHGLRKALAGLRIGPGIDDASDIGPLVSSQARKEYLAALDTVGTRAELELFGDPPEDGFYVQPAVALGADPSDAVFRDEVFGPLISVFPVAGLEEGIARCNDTPYGLSASLFSRRLGSAMTFVDQIEAGIVHVNSQTTGAEPHLPFGGFKRSSSYSRELGRWGLEFFSQVKSVYLDG